MAVNFAKSTDVLKNAFLEKGVRSIPRLDVVFDLDVSGSYKEAHKDGSTNKIITRLVPWGLVFDRDKQLDVFTYSNGARNVVRVGEVNALNYEGFVKREVIDKVTGYGGGTDYSYVLEKNLDHFGWTSDGGAQRPLLALFNTDGDCHPDDESRTDKLFARMEVERLKVYVLFIAYANGNPSFRFIKRMAEKYSNVGIHIIKPLSEFIDASDEQLTKWLINDELVTWLNN